MKALAAAATVIVAGDDDQESRRLAEAVAAVAGTASFPSVTLFHEPDASRAWAGTGRHAVCRTATLALAAVRAVPPWSPASASPPPIVVGDTPLADAIADRIAVGWTQPGERTTIHRIVSYRTKLTPSEDVDEASSPEDVVRVAVQRQAAWPAPPPTHATLTGPTIYVATADRPGELAALLAQRVEGCRVCVISDSPVAESERLTVVSRRVHLVDPAVLIMTPERLLVEELFAEASHWPQEVPCLFGELSREAASGSVLPLDAQREAVRVGVDAVAGLADDALRDLGLLLEAPEEGAPVVLVPRELVAVADRLAAGAPLPPGVGATEHWQRALELAGHLPTLAARAGRRVRRPDGYVDPFARLVQCAPNAHAHYRLAVQAANADRPYAGREWNDLSPFEQSSNRAQLVDIPAKLAAAGLDIRPAADPDAPLFAFEANTLERLAQLEHRRWEHHQRRNGRQHHTLAVPWEQLSEDERDFDRDVVCAIPRVLRLLGLDVVDLHH